MEEEIEPQFPIIPKPGQQDRFEKHNDELAGLFKKVKSDDLSDLTTVSEEDVMGDPSTDEDNYGDMSDLTTVDTDDIMGNKKKPKPRFRILPRRGYSRPLPPPSIGRVQY